jgi:hypothetical protein
MAMRRRNRADRDRTEPAPAEPAVAAAGGDFADLGPEFTARIDAILDDVRVEADRILDEARRKAAGGAADIDEQLAYRRLRLLELYETLIARAELVLGRLDDVEFGRESLGRMLRAVSQAADELTLEVGAESRVPRALAESDGPRAQPH